MLLIPGRLWRSEPLFWPTGVEDSALATFLDLSVPGTLFGTILVALGSFWSAPDGLVGQVQKRVLN